MHHRIATPADVPEIAALMERAIAELQRGYLGDDAIAASRGAMGLDLQLIEDGTYFVVEIEGALAGCGGWSFRSTLYGGDSAAALRDARTLDPATEPARVRAMYTDPAFTRRGIGRAILALCESSARDAGYRRVELMATLAGEPLYVACGYRSIERVANMAPGSVAVPGVRMGKAL